MNYRLLKYTCRVKCWDGVVRTFEHTGHFTNATILRHHLARWDGCIGPAGEPYDYFETPEQALHNDVASAIDFRKLPPDVLCYFGANGHNYEITRRT